MASTKVLSILLALLVISMIAFEASAKPRLPGAPGRQGSLRPRQCKPQCLRRCGNTQYYNNCMLFCLKCCNKCLCVPPGYYGNKQVCPCYNNWKTKEGGPKCP